ncbi:kinase-like protein, partial [Schizopora paradoxa]
KRMLCQEAVLWRMTNHPNVLRFLGLGILDDARGSIAFVSPWMLNGNLLNYVKKNQTTNRADLLAQAGNGLLYLHSVEIIHGDLKCTNIMVDNEGNPQLSDFGLSTVEPIQTIVASSMSLSGGNPRWSAPELIFPDLFRGSGKSTRASDVYSFGMTALELFMEKVPFYDIQDAALPLEIAINGLEPSWPGREAEVRGLTENIWKMMQGFWKREPSSRTPLRCGMLNASLLSLTNVQITPKEGCILKRGVPQQYTALLPGIWDIESCSMTPESPTWFSTVARITARRSRPLDDYASPLDQIKIAHFAARIIRNDGRGCCCNVRHSFIHRLALF